MKRIIGLLIMVATIGACSSPKGYKWHEDEVQGYEVVLWNGTRDTLYTTLQGVVNTYEYGDVLSICLLDTDYYIGIK